MKRILAAFVILAMLLSSVPALGEETDPAGETEEEAAGAAAESPATPTDLCAHVNTETVYYFGAPAYQALDAKEHSVTGRAQVVIRCVDCGEILSIGVEEDAMEIDPHVFHKGRCVLCGREEPAPPEEPEPKPEPDPEPEPAPENGTETGSETEPEAGSEPVVVPDNAPETIPEPASARAPSQAPAVESVFELFPLDGSPDQFAVTLTGRDLENAGSTVVLRPEGRDAAIVLQAHAILETMDRSGGTLTARLAGAGARDVNASVRVYAADGREAAHDGTGISLRIYGEGGEFLTVSFSNGEGDAVVQEAGWVSAEDGGYWDVAWEGNGNYRY